MASYLNESSFDYNSTINQTGIKTVSIDDDCNFFPTAWMFLNIKELDLLSLKQTRADCLQLSTMSGSWVICPYQNTSTNSVSISCNGESHQMIWLHQINLFAKLFASLVT